MKQRLTFLKEDRERMLTDDRLVSILLKSFAGNPEPQVYQRISKENQSRGPDRASFDIEAFLDHRDYHTGNEHITRLDEPKVIADVLRRVQQCRIINGRIYEILPKLKLDGEYVVSEQGKPAIRVIGTPEEESPWIYRPTRFESYDGKNVFSHIPMPDEKRVDLELSVESNNNREKIEHCYRKALGYYREEGFTLSRPTEHAETN
jgi:hypothetical protein